MISETDPAIPRQPTDGCAAIQSGKPCPERDVFEGERAGGGLCADWQRPLTVVTPEIVNATDGGLAALILGQTIYWCSPDNRDNGFRTWAEKNGAPFWDGSYESFGRSLGANATKARHAIDKLVRDGLLVRLRQDMLYLTPTLVGWRLRYPDASELYTLPVRASLRTQTCLSDSFNDPALRPAMRANVELPVVQPRQRKIRVPSVFVLICHQNFNAAIVLSNLHFWRAYNHKHHTIRAINGSTDWLWKSWRQHAAETGLGIKQLENAVAFLRQRGFITSRHAKPHRGTRLRIHFRLEFDRMRAELEKLFFEDRCWI